MSGVSSHFVQGVAAAGTIVAAETAHAFGDVDDWVALVERLGLAVALVAFFVYTGWKREQRMAKRIDMLEKENDKLATSIARLTEQVNAALLKATEAVGAISNRTCFAFRNREDYEKALQRLKDAERR